MADNRILTANFRLSRRVKTASLYQYDYGQVLRFLGVSLPNTYEVHFSGSESGGEAVTVLGNADGVQIPDMLLATGNTVHAWIFLHDAATDGETEYKVEIPVIRRSRATDAEPTPVQQDIITQAIAALNEGVATVEEAVAGVGEAIDTALQEAKDSGEFDGEDGYTPVKGVDYFDGQDGKDGEPGKDGATGPAGISPTISVTDITGGHRVTITDATGPHSFDVMDGEDGQGAVQDVQVNGVSVLQDGVANVPSADANTYGVVRTGSVSVSGTTPTINALPGVRYVCGECATLEIIVPASGCIDVTFESGTTATVLTVTPQTGVTVKWAGGFDPTSLDANTTYEINVCDGLGVVGQWT